MLVHVGREELPADLVRIEIEVPNDLEIEVVQIRSLPTSWRNYPAAEALQQIGNDWLREGHSPVLQVPSAIIAEESNYLLNPAHPRAVEVSVISLADFVFDPRLAP